MHLLHQFEPNPITLTIYTARVIITNSSPLLILTNFTCSNPNFPHTRCARLLNSAIVRKQGIS